LPEDNGACAQKEEEKNNAIFRAILHKHFTMGKALYPS